MATSGTARARAGTDAAELTDATERGAARGSLGTGSWHRRYGRLYEELRRPAQTMVRRAFGRAFCEQEIEDLYGNAWLGTLRALDRRRDALGDDELRRYILTAVANQASKELRRRGRRPTAPLDLARGVADRASLPDEHVADREDSQVARDVLATLPPRRRAVLLLRYGWGLEPREVCGLIKGLSHRAYRKEITRGVRELSAKLGLVEGGQWCESREPVLHAYVAGVADEEQRRQAEHHLAHCRPCTDYVGKLSGHLHEVGSSVAWTGVVDAVGGERVAIADRLSEATDRARESMAGFLARGPTDSGEIAVQAAAAGGPRGAGLGAAGGLAKLAGLGAAPKLVAACLGTGAAATACVAAGIGPVDLSGKGRGPGVDRAAEARADRDGASRIPVRLPPQLENGGGGPAEAPGSGTGDNAGSSKPAPAPEPEPAPPTTSPAPPTQQEFGLAAGGTGGGGATQAGSTSGGGGGTGSGDGGAGAVAREFGP